MNILVTGLCLQGNKGGPAIGLALKDQLETRLDDPRFVFGVPGGARFGREVQWAERYGVEVVRNLRPKDLVVPATYSLGADANGTPRWIGAFRRADVVIEMSALSYVGPPERARRSLLFNPRFRYFAMSKLIGKPFFAWTQSYGPFSTGSLRRAARWDLGSQPIVFCRGEKTQALVEELLPGRPTRSFPDVAVALKYDPEFGAHYVRDKFPDDDCEKLITLSPSAVIEAKTAGSQRPHGDVLTDVCARLAGAGYKILLVPHTYHPDLPDPNVCDHALSKNILEGCGGNPAVAMAEEDLSVMELKSIISRARIHVGARYHSIIAALSSCVPAVSLSWHHKYADIMRMYGVERWVHDAVGDPSAENLCALIEELDREFAVVKRTVEAAHPKALDAVKENAELFAGLIKGEAP